MKTGISMIVLAGILASGVAQAQMRGNDGRDNNNGNDGRGGFDRPHQGPPQQFQPQQPFRPQPPQQQFQPQHPQRPSPGPGFGGGGGFPGGRPDFDHDHGGGNPGWNHGNYQDQIIARNATRLVGLLYQAGLFRQADQGGLIANVRALQNGGMQALSDIARSIGNSQEYYSNIERRYRPQEILRNFYIQLLGRDVDPSGSQTYLPLIFRHDAGSVLAGIVTSPEFAQRNLQ